MNCLLDTHAFLWFVNDHYSLFSAPTVSNLFPGESPPRPYTNIVSGESPPRPCIESAGVLPPPIDMGGPRGVDRCCAPPIPMGGLKGVDCGGYHAHS